MTSEQFRQQYHLLDRVVDGPVATHHAQSATGTMVVMVHFLQGTGEENARVLRDLSTLDEAHRVRVLKVVEVDGQTTVVTKFILDFTSFEEWLANGQQAAASMSAEQLSSQEPPAEAARAAPAVTPEPGEFTRVFSAPPLPRTSSGPTPEIAPTPSTPSDVAPAQSDVSGEFTRVFRGLPVDSRAQGVASAPNETSPAAPVEASQPASRAAAVPPRDMPPTERSRPEVPVPWPLSAAHQPQASSSRELPSPEPAPSADARAHADAPGEYTRIFGKGGSSPVTSIGTGSDAVSAQPPANLDWSSQGQPLLPGGEETYFERLAGTPPVHHQDMPAHREPLMPQSYAGRSEFTRIISSPLPIAAVGSSANRSGQPADATRSTPEKKSGDRVLLFSLIGVVVLAIVFVIIFALFA